MVKKTYQISQEDAEWLVSYACRYRSVRTIIDEQNLFMYVHTTFADNDQPTSIAAKFQLELLSDEPPQMPQEEHERRVQGKP